MRSLKKDKSTDEKCGFTQSQWHTGLVENLFPISFYISIKHAYMYTHICMHARNTKAQDLHAFKNKL